ncbi:hypothetical protein EJB05_43329, partial [Eragrostis curvula]
MEEEEAEIVDANTKDDAPVASTIPSGDTKDDVPVAGTIPSGDTKDDVPVAGTIPSAIDTKDAHALAAAHAPGKIEDGVVDTLRKEGRTWLIILIVVSILLAAAAAVALWFSRHDPLIAVWGLSYLLCFASSLWTYFLTKTMGAHVFFYNAIGILLAHLFSSTAVSSSTGALVAHLNTHFAACLLGYAVAEHRQHQGTEEASAVLVPDMDEGRLRRPHCIVVGIFVYVPVLALLAVAAWLMCHAAEYAIEDLLCATFVTVSVISVFGIFFPAMTPRLRVILISPSVFLFVVMYFVIILVTAVVIYETLGGVAAMVFAWVGSLGLTELFGHCLYVLATFTQIKRTIEGAVGVAERARLRKCTSCSVHQKNKL